MASSSIYSPSTSAALKRKRDSEGEEVNSSKKPKLTADPAKPFPPSRKATTSPSQNKQRKADTPVDTQSAKKHNVDDATTPSSSASVAKEHKTIEVPAVSSTHTTSSSPAKTKEASKPAKVLTNAANKRKRNITKEPEESHRLVKKTKTIETSGEQSGKENKSLRSSQRLQPDEDKRQCERKARQERLRKMREQRSNDLDFSEGEESSDWDRPSTPAKKTKKSSGVQKQKKEEKVNKASSRKVAGAQKPSKVSDAEHYASIRAYEKKMEAHKATDKYQAWLSQGQRKIRAWLQRHGMFSLHADHPDRPFWLEMRKFCTKHGLGALEELNEEQLYRAAGEARMQVALDFEVGSYHNGTRELFVKARNAERRATDLEDKRILGLKTTKFLNMFEDMKEKVRQWKEARKAWFDAVQREEAMCLNTYKPHHSEDYLPDGSDNLAAKERRRDEYFKGKLPHEYLDMPQQWKVKFA
jgi:hypothetical protein